MFILPRLTRRFQVMGETALVNPFGTHIVHESVVFRLTYKFNFLMLTPSKSKSLSIIDGKQSAAVGSGSY